MLGSLLSIVAWRIDTRGRAQRLDRTFEHDALERAHSIDRATVRISDTIRSLAAFDAASEHVTRAEFETFARQLIAASPAIVALEWVPIIRREGRELHEATTRADGRRDYGIREIGADGTLSPARQREEYCPVHFVEPEIGNAPVVGLDLCSDTRRAAAVTIARRTRQTTATGRIRLVQGHPDDTDADAAAPPYGILLMEPVRDGVAGDPARSTRDGVYVGVVRITNLVAVGVDPERDSRFRLQLRDLTAAPSEQLLYDQWQDTVDVVVAGIRLHHSSFVEVGGRTWQLESLPSSTWLAGREESEGWLVLLTGLALSLAFASYLWQHQRVESKLRYAAYHDPLTGLPNRSQFIARLTELQIELDSGRGSAYAVLFIDLDRFKLINDSLGHTVGDELLIAVAERLRSCLRESDLVARIGGDEFTVLLQRVESADDAHEFASRLAAAMRRPITTSSGEAYVTCSIGIATHDEKGIVRDLLRDSDIAMYRAKTDGRSRCVTFDSEMRADLVRRQQLEHDLRHALKGDELELLYQPIISLDTQEVSSFEALARWNHPKHGQLSPLNFISLAEETGLIEELGRLLLSRSLEQAILWRDWAKANNRPPVTIQVNVSAHQLTSSDGRKGLRQALSDDPSVVALEITESVLLEDFADVVTFLREIRDAGTHICIDDFGTGYSSLSYLHRLPVDSLKIDRSFVQRLGRQPGDNSLVETILLLARQLGIEVTAEGIETQAQADALRRLHCNRVQGFYYSPPLGVAEATRVMQLGHSEPRGQSRRSA